MSAANVQIRAASPSDVEVLTDFNCRLAAETEGKVLDPATVRNGVLRGLSIGEEVQYWVAEVDAVVVGQLMLTREWSDWRDGWMYWLQSVYVAAEFRGQSVFRKLLDHAKVQLQQRDDVAGLRLYVEEDNQVAIGTYRRLGFADPGYRVMEVSVVKCRPTTTAD